MFKKITTLVIAAELTACVYLLAYCKRPAPVMAQQSCGICYNELLTETNEVLTNKLCGEKK